MLTGLNHITLAVRDLTRSIDFYQGVLDLRLAARWDSGAYLSLGDLWLCLALDTGKAEGSTQDYTHYAFSISPSDFSPWVERLRRQGIKEWKDNLSEGESLYFLDPDGHKLEAHVGSLVSRLAQCRTHPYAGMQFFDCPLPVS